jgi:hypothetical protein
MCLFGAPAVTSANGAHPHNVGTLPPRHNRHVCVVHCEQSVGWRRRRRWCDRRCRCRRWRCRFGEGASRGGWRRGARGRPGLSRPVHFPGPLRRRGHRLKFGDDWIRIDPRRSARHEIAGHTDHVGRDRRRLEFVHGEGDGEIRPLRRRDADRARRLATGSEGGAGIGTRRRRFEPNLHGRRGRFESVQRKRGAAGKA